jgi:hypothetical protein
MAFNKLNTLFDELQDAAMQAIKSLAQEVRVEVQDQKNKQF